MNRDRQKILPFEYLLEEGFPAQDVLRQQVLDAQAMAQRAIDRLTARKPPQPPVTAADLVLVIAATAAETRAETRYWARVVLDEISGPTNEAG